MSNKAKNTSNLAEHVLTVRVYYNDVSEDKIQESLNVLKEEKVFMSGFFKFILEHPDFVKECTKKIPNLRRYRKGVY